MLSKDPLHGKTLEMILTYLVEKMGWEGMVKLRIIRCLKMNPTINPSLTF